MGKETGISWCDHTFNPWTGCVKVSEACRNCYAERDTNRWGKQLWGPKTDREQRAEAYWRQPEKWNKEAKEAGVRRRVFCMSMGDFWENRPDLKEPRRRTLELMEKCEHLDWLILTKRPKLAPTLLQAAGFGHWMIGGWPQNVWAGVTAEAQKDLDARAQWLIKLPAPVRFLSCEPLLEDIWPCQYFWDHCENCGGSGNDAVTIDGMCGQCSGHGMSEKLTNAIHWVICGGESGPKARAMKPEWANNLRSQCEAAGVAFHFKQWGEWVTEDQAPEDAVMPSTSRMLFATGVDFTKGDQTGYYKLGAKASGRYLNGKVYDELPKVGG